MVPDWSRTRVLDPQGARINRLAPPVLIEGLLVDNNGLGTVVDRLKIPPAVIGLPSNTPPDFAGRKKSASSTVDKMDAIGLTPD